MDIIMREGVYIKRKGLYLGNGYFLVNKGYMFNYLFINKYVN